MAPAGARISTALRQRLRQGCSILRNKIGGRRHWRNMGHHVHECTQPAALTMPAPLLPLLLLPPALPLLPLPALPLLPPPLPLAAPAAGWLPAMTATPAGQLPPPPARATQASGAPQPWWLPLAAAAAPATSAPPTPCRACRPVKVGEEEKHYANALIYLYIKGVKDAWRNAAIACPPEGLASPPNHHTQSRCPPHPPPPAAAVGAHRRDADFRDGPVAVICPAGAAELGTQAMLGQPAEQLKSCTQQEWRGGGQVGGTGSGGSSGGGSTGRAGIRARGRPAA